MMTDEKKRRHAEAQKKYYRTHREQRIKAMKRYHEAIRQDPNAALCGTRIREYRRLHGLTQKQLARQMGVSVTTICHAENGYAYITRSRIKNIPALLEYMEEAGCRI